MSKFKKGDIVGRISYNKDVLFEIKIKCKIFHNESLSRGSSLSLRNTVLCPSVMSDSL